MKAINYLVTIFLLFLTPFQIASAEVPKSFRQAKIIATKIYQSNPISFYCDCTYSLKKKPNKNSKRLTPDWASCGFTPRINRNRAGRIEWEHIMPAYHFGLQRKCWQKGGRKACKKDPVFKKMESDLHNLVPVIGEINGDRSNFKFGMIESESRRYGACDMEIDFKRKRAEPAKNKRGDIARIYFYMRDEYKLKLSKQQTRLLEAWNKIDPIDDWERERNERIYQHQSNRNPYIQ